MNTVPSHADLTRGDGFRAVNGQPIVEIAQTTLRSGASLVAVWDELEPIVRSLIGRVRTFVDSDAPLKPVETTKLLSQCAGVVQKLSHTGQGILRASEGLSKLALLMDAGKVKRAHPSELTQKQLAGVLVETLKKLGDDGPCPLCHTAKAIDVA